MSVSISPAKLLDIININLRVVDKKEATLRCDEGAKVSMIRGLLHGNETHSVRFKDELIAIYGVADNKTIWMMGTDRLGDADILFAHRIVKKEIKKLVQKYGVLENFVWANNLVHIDWIKFAGFRFTGHDFTYNNETFLHFEMCK